MVISSRRTPVIGAPSAPAETIIPKPWGREIIAWTIFGEGTSKRIEINAGARLSLQYHEHKSECVLLVSGQGYLETYPEGLSGAMRCQDFRSAGSHTIVPIPAGLIHRMGAYSAVEGGQGCAFLELAHGDDADVIRLQDDYGR